MADRTVFFQPYYPFSRFVPLRTQSACDVVPAAPALTSVLRKVDEQGLALKTLEKVVHDQASTAKLRDLSIAKEKTSKEIADHALAITQQATSIGRQARAIETLQHDTIILAAVVFGTICVLLGCWMLAAIRKVRLRKSRNDSMASAEDIIAALDRSVNRGK
jgi:hypothetical protein